MNILMALTRLLIGGYIDRAKIKLTNKLSMILGALILGAICLLLCMIALIFISISLVSLLSASVGSAWAHLIVGGIYLFIVAILVIFKYRMIYRPVSRKLSSKILHR